TIGRSLTAGAATAAEVPRAALHSRRRQILHTGDALGGIGNRLSGCHARLSRSGFSCQESRAGAKTLDGTPLPCYSLTYSPISSPSAASAPPVAVEEPARSRPGPGVPRRFPFPG